MAFFNRQFCFGSVVLLGLFLGSSVASVGQEFRIETDVYINKSLKPNSQNVTLFSDTIVYDFQLSSTTGSGVSEITIFDRQKREFVLLNLERKVRLKLEVAHVWKIVESLRSETLQNEASRFLANVNFKDSFDQTTNWVSAKNDIMEYQFTGKRPGNVAILPAYHDFLDHYSMLSATDPRRLPPFARLRFNGVIKKYGWLPTEIRLSVKSNEFFKESFTARSIHTFNSKLSKKDRQRIQTAKSSKSSFKDVSIAQYRGLSAREANAKENKSR